MGRSIKKAAVATGHGSGELGLLLEDIRVQLAALTADVTAVRSALVTHLANGGHTAAANTTAGNVTAATPAAITATNLLDA